MCDFAGAEGNERSRVWYSSDAELLGTGVTNDRYWDIGTGPRCGSRDRTAKSRHLSVQCRLLRYILYRLQKPCPETTSHPPPIAPFLARWRDGRPPRLRQGQHDRAEGPPTDRRTEESRLHKGMDGQSLRGLDHRPKLEAVLDHLRPGDTLVVWRLDRLGRNLRHLIATVNDLAADGVGFKSLTEGIDTTTPAGRLTFHLFGALAEFERELIRERTAAGLAAARARGRSGGRPRAMTPEKLSVARQMYEGREHTLAAIGAVVGVSRSTLYRYLGGQGRPELSSLKGREETRTNRVGSRPPTGKQLPGRQLPDSRDKARPRDAPVPRDKRQRSNPRRGHDQPVPRVR